MVPLRCSNSQCPSKTRKMRKGMEIMIKLTAVSASLVKPSFFKYLDSN